jgi:hypothetical protein
MVLFDDLRTVDPHFRVHRFPRGARRRWAGQTLARHPGAETGHIVVFAYQLATGMLNFAQAGPPLIINAIFSVLLFLFRKDISA